MKRCLLLLLIMAMAGVQSGCYSNLPYRTKQANHPVSAVYDPEPADHPGCQPGAKPGNCHPYYQAYIEFDEFGEMWDPNQLDLAVQQIRKAASPGAILCAGKSRPEAGPIKLVVFLHGWKNNASEDSGNVWGFRDELRYITEQHCNTPDSLPVVGVYIGWRGGVIKAPVIKEFTYWDRHRTAQELPGVHLTYALNRLSYEAKHMKDAKESKVIFIGHSFGGQVLERALNQSVLEYLMGVVEQRDKSELQSEAKQLAPVRRKYKDIEPPFDLVLFLNEAAPATESFQMMNFLAENNIHFMPETTGGREVPLFVSMTSLGDSATGVALPIGQSLARLTHSTHKYENPEVHANINDQSTFYTHSTANIPALHSHSVKKCSEFTSVEAASAIQFHSQTNQSYCIVRDPSAWNQTPYWVMQLPTDIVPDHTSVFGPELQELISQLVAKTSAPHPRLQMEPK